jgi:hypothetical protein
VWTYARRLVLTVESGNRHADDDLADARAGVFRSFSSSATGTISSGLHRSLRPLRLQGILRSTVHVANDYKVLAGIQQYLGKKPRGRHLCAGVNGPTARAPQVRAWSGSGGLYGTRGQVAEAAGQFAALKGKVDRLQFLDDRKLAFASRFAGCTSS